MKITVLSLAFLFIPLHGLRAQERETWNLSPMKGTQVFYASHIGKSNASNLTNDERRTLTAAIADNSSMPPMRSPESVHTEMAASTLNVRWAQSSSKDHTDPAGIASVVHAAGEDGMIAYRSGHTITFILNSDKVTQVYTIHTNVRMPDGGYLVTLTGVRNSFIGVTSLNFSGSARLGR
jgi:hypothetical protein